MTTKPQHEQDCETARAGIDCTDPYACASAVGALSRLHSEAAKVPGLESALRLAKEVLRDTGGAIADIVGHPRDNESGDDLVASVRSKVSGLEADNAALLKGISTYHEAWKQGRDVVPLANLLKVAESHGPGAALLERIAKAESERDELRSDLNKNFALGQADHRAIHDALGWAHGWHGKTLPAPWRGVTALIQERDTARERVATLEKLAYLGDHHFPDATWKARCEETVTDLRAAEARVKELTAQLAGARNAALEEAASEVHKLLDTPAVGLSKRMALTEAESNIRALASQPPPAPARPECGHVLTGRPPGSLRATCRKAPHGDDVPHRWDEEPGTATPHPARAGGAGRGPHGSRRLPVRGPGPPWPRARVARAGRTRPADARDAPTGRGHPRSQAWGGAMSASLVEAVGPFIELGDRVADTVVLKDPNAVVAHICDDGCHYREVKVRDFQRLRAAYDAAKGGASLVHCPGCKQMAPAEQMHTRCTMCAAYEDERLRQSTLEDSDDADDAAKYRAAVQRAKDANGIWRAVARADIGTSTDISAEDPDASYYENMGRAAVNYVLGLTLDVGGGK